MLSEKGFVHILAIGAILALIGGLGAGVYLVQHRTSLSPKAEDLSKQTTNPPFISAFERIVNRLKASNTSHVSAFDLIVSRLKAGTSQVTSTTRSDVRPPAVQASTAPTLIQPSQTNVSTTPTQAPSSSQNANVSPTPTPAPSATPSLIPTPTPSGSTATIATNNDSDSDGDPNPTDCGPNDSRAHHGQTQFFYTSFTDKFGHSSFDFNCDGVETKVNTCITTLPVQYCSTSKPIGTPGWVGSPPACGSNIGTYRGCGGAFTDMYSCYGNHYSELAIDPSDPNNKNCTTLCQNLSYSGVSYSIDNVDSVFNMSCN